MWVRRGAGILVLVVSVAYPLQARAQVPAGPEFRVNTYTTYSQEPGQVAMDGSGNFVVTWASRRGPVDIDVLAQRFGASGAPVGAEFRVNTVTSGFQYDPRLAMNATGGFVVVWSRAYYGVSGSEIRGRRFDAAGLPSGAEFRVNTYTSQYPRDPVVAAGPLGAFVVSWTSPGQGAALLDVFAQRFDGGGAKVGAELRVNSFTTGYQTSPAVAFGAAGSFVVAWESFNQDASSSGVVARRFDAAGAPLGGEFLVNTYTTGGQYNVSVAASPAGDFVVSWTSRGQDGGAYDNGVFAQRYDAAASRLGGEFRVNTYTPSDQSQPAVAVDAAGGFVVAWQSAGQDGQYYGVFGQRFDAAGTPRGAEFRVNATTTNSQMFSSAAADAGGNFVVAWRSSLQDGSGEGVFAQRFGGLAPVALAVDAPANGVWEPGEFVEMKPSWRNVNGAAQAFGGRLANITGPAGATYGIGDNSASYGTVANGGSAPCTDCYVVLVNDPSPRPVLHWDASAVETITPDAHGQTQRWALHIGRSFTDVPIASPFYKFIETLLHNGVTGGCTAATYCPATPTTRDQMAVFVLVAKEGAGYAPPACTTPVFGDVPASNPFCRFIEELARRNVVGGCGGGNYCPGSPVTREQMAIFTLRTLDPALDPPACGTPVFADVPASSPFCRWIEELARRNVVTGCGGGNYCPTASVTREQMGVFISATFGLTLYGL